MVDHGRKRPAVFTDTETHEMTMESMHWLRNNVAVGFTDTRGPAWWNSRGFGFAGGVDMGIRDDGRPNHYPGPIPVEDLASLLFAHEIESVPVYVPNPEFDGTNPDVPEFVQIPERQATRHSGNGTVYGIFRPGYEIHQPSAFVVQIENILDDDVSVGSAGSLRDGAVSWVSVEVPENITTPDGVEFRPNLYAMTSHDGTMATMFGRCVTNIVCDNTLRAATNEAGQKLKVKHTKNSGFRIQTARDALAVIHSETEDFANWTESLLRIKVTEKSFGKFLDLWSPVPQDTEKAKANARAVTLSENRRETLTSLWKSDPRVEPWKGTGWGVVQAVNTYDQHLSSVHTGGDTDPAVKQFARWQRSLFGAANGDLDKRTADVQAMLSAAVGK